MLNLDIEQFWKDDSIAHKENCFNKDAKQVALGLRMSEECVYAELGIEEKTPWGNLPRERKIELSKRYNEKALNTVGIELVCEDYPKDDSQYPKTRKIEEVFKGDIKTPKELEILLKRIERMNQSDLKEFILPANWDKDKKRIYEMYGIEPSVVCSMIGPVSLAAFVYGAENLIYLIYDEPDLAIRFSNAITNVIISYIDVFDSAKKTFGFTFVDNYCHILTPEMYQLFAYPIIKKVFERTSPNRNDLRCLKVESNIKHLLPVLGQLDLTDCSFGSSVSIQEIREYMKDTRINGQISPLTLAKNENDKLIQEVKRDCKMAKDKDIRGVSITTAGKVKAGSLLVSMKTIMATIQNYGRY